VKQRSDLTFKHNVSLGRHGWLRLTPAYSIKVVEQVLDANTQIKRVLDPFSGTGTTGLVCAERGLDCDLLDINPFLAWFAEVKTRSYSAPEVADARNSLDDLSRALAGDVAEWYPPIHDIDRWWSEDARKMLAQLHTWISVHSGATRDLLSVAFCRCLISWSYAAFNHQSMSFKQPVPTLESDLFPARETRIEHFRREALWIFEGAERHILGDVRVHLMDSRAVSIDQQSFDAVITSPPYPNRVSYIRELRPYMYWLGYLTDAKQAGEMDWQAIGGTWGCATSLVGKWRANGDLVPYSGFQDIVKSIRNRSPILANYVHKYFVDMTEHMRSVVSALRPGGKLFYIVGNSKYYDTLVPVEEIFASMMEHAGMTSVSIERIRKRNSKKELYEFIVSAVHPQTLAASRNDRSAKDTIIAHEVLANHR
jgi:DNA modification methylase